MTIHCRHKENSFQRPLPPQLPRNFCWEGKYLVPDLGIIVPFRWVGNNGDIQMIAGNSSTPVYFTNLIFQNRLYTYTFAWPGLQPEFLPPLEPCAPLFSLTLEQLNAFFATASYVGPEIISNNTNGDGLMVKRKCKKKNKKHKRGIKVHHWRVSFVLPNFFPSGAYPRFPIASADIYVCRKDPTKFVKVLHFGLQNLYDPRLDEWIVIEKRSSHPGNIQIPPVCLASSSISSFSTSSSGTLPGTLPGITTLEQFARERVSNIIL